MLKKGLSLLDKLFPDYCVKLHEAGAVETDYLKDIIVVSNLPCLTAIMGTWTASSSGAQDARNLSLHLVRDTNMFSNWPTSSSNSA